MYEQKLECNIKDDSKSFYTYVRSKQKYKLFIFSSVFTSEDISSLQVPDAKFQEAKSDYLGQLIVTPEMVAKKIKATKDNKSPEVDGIPPKLLMETVEHISISLARVVNLSLKEGVVPVE